ncbi:uncharacterized protein A4U43_C10F14200 [Asparagus officinalis]|uniref:Uncharacterized protein n=1 Tax=Asparagus officinalis TaxID=4686 RepID=A0A5P1E343_ASPOF|nr:uncharacterized protein A4U43_C10F14200 [Asparagus officinalis]
MDRTPKEYFSLADRTKSADISLGQWLATLSPRLSMQSSSEDGSGGLSSGANGSMWALSGYNSRSIVSVDPLAEHEGGGGTGSIAELLGRGEPAMMSMELGMADKHMVVWFVNS